MEAPLDHKACKAARALLDVTAGQLAEMSGLSVDTLRSFESNRTRTLSRENEARLRKAIDAAGVAILSNGDTAEGAGVAYKGSDQ